MMTSTPLIMSLSRQRAEAIACYRAGARDGSLDRVRIETGTIADYRALAQFHYKSGHPGAVKSVLRMVCDLPSAVGRFLGRRDQPRLIGVLVRSLPQLSCQLRNVATCHRYTGMKPRDAAVMLNREVRTISRVVIDPQWRGLGLAVLLVKRALREPEPGVVYTEALAAMGRVSPFFEHAGMIRYDRPQRADHARLIDAMTHIGVGAHELASTAAIEERLTRDVEARTFIMQELRRWHRAAHRTPRGQLEAMTIAHLLDAARQQLFAQPVYYIHHHADHTPSGDHHAQAID